MQVYSYAVAVTLIGGVVVGFDDATNEGAGKTAYEAIFGGADAHSFKAMSHDADSDSNAMMYVNKDAIMFATYTVSVSAETVTDDVCNSGE